LISGKNNWKGKKDGKVPTLRRIEGKKMVLKKLNAILSKRIERGLCLYLRKREGGTTTIRRRKKEKQLKSVGNNPQIP